MDIRYHGLHGYAAALTAIGKTQQQPQTGGFSHVPANNLEHLKNHLTYLTAGKVAGMIVEPLQGYGGIFPLNDVSGATNRLFPRAWRQLAIPTDLVPRPRPTPLCLPPRL